MLNEPSSHPSAPQRARRARFHHLAKFGLSILTSGGLVLGIVSCTEEDPEPGPLTQSGGTTSTTGGSSGQAGSGESGAAGGVNGEGGGTAGAGQGGVAGSAAGSGGAPQVGGADNGGAGGSVEPEPAPDKEPVGLRIMGQQMTARVSRIPEGGAAIGGTTLWDTCPEDQILIGLHQMYGPNTASPDLISGLIPICSPLKLTGTAGAYSIEIDNTQRSPLQVRGGLQAVAGVEQGPTCPVNHVVIGYEARYNDWIRWITLTCAPLQVTGALGSYKIEIGTALKLPAYGKASAFGGIDQPFPYSQCPTGTIARGTRIDAGQHVETLALTCGTPTFTHPEGTVCARNAACASSLCNGTTCDPTPSACTAPTGCTCATFEAKQYMYCDNTMTKTWDAAQAQCQAYGMHLVHPETGLENGWLRSHADSVNALGDLWIGATDQGSADNWKWSDGTQVPIALQEFKGLEALWHEEEPQPDPGNAFGCAVVMGGHTDSMRRHGSWDDVDCTQLYSFVCEKN